MPQGQKKAAERGKCRKDITPGVIFLGRGIKNGTTVIVRWGAISCILHMYILEAAHIGPSLFYLLVEDYDIFNGDY